MKILCFGSLNIDYVYQVDHFVKKGETLASLGMHVYPGGKGLNQSVALAKAGAEVYHAGVIGREGLFLKELLQNAGVHTEFVEEREGIRTGHTIIQNDKSGDNCILLYGGANQAITPEMIDRVLASFGAGDYLLLQNEINGLPYLIQKAHVKGMMIALNPSPMEEKLLELPLELIDLIFVNEIEACQLLQWDLSESSDADALSDGLAQRLPGAAVVLTLGSEGSYYRKGDVRVRQAAFPVKAVDTTAAGDTFTGYLLAGILEGMDMETCMSRAAKAAAIAVTKPGAAVSIPTREEVENS